MITRAWTTSIGAKTALILLGVVLFNIAIDGALQRSFMTSSFVALERDEARDDLRRAESIIEDEIRDLEIIGKQWASSDGTYGYVLAPDREFEQSSLGQSALAKAELDLLMICAPDGRVVWSRIEDPATRAPLRLREFPSERLASSHPCIAFRTEAGAQVQRIAGLMGAGDRPMIVSSQEIHDSEGGGESRGRLIVGRFLDGAFLEELGRRARVEFHVWPLHGSELPAEAETLRDRITGKGLGEVVVDERPEGRLHLYTTMDDVNAAPELILRADVEREISARGYRAAGYALLSALFTALLILFVLLRLLKRFVVAPLSTLTRHVVEIGRTDDTSARVGLERGDEIGKLSHEFDRMMEKLASSREEIVRTARRAGMSEIATGVLHNVGNVLNSVNVSTNMVARKLDKLSLEDLSKLGEVLEQHRDDLGRFVTEDARGRHLLPFLSQLSATLARQREDVALELRSVETGVAHIAEMVRAQQSIAGTRGVFEKAALEREIEAAIKVCQQAYGGLEGILVQREFEELPRVSVDKHKLMEILVNLIHNAQQALEESTSSERRLTFRLRRAQDRARIEVEDTGVGIPHENLTRIFHHGFTTKPNGHGFGLHVSANAATEMRSTLSARSPGPGKGATFVLEIPMEQEAEPALAA